MTITLTLDIFSGRENPTVTLSGAQSRDLLERLIPARRLERDEPGLPAETRLGYRGMIVEVSRDDADAAGLPTRFHIVGNDVFARGLAHRVRDEGLEEYLLSPDGPLAGSDLDPSILDALPREMRLLDEWRVKWPIDDSIVWPPVRPRCRCAPLYEPAWWNAPSRRPFNNCYNYATNYRTNTFAQPGRAAGAMYPSLTCGAVHTAALADCLLDAPDEIACPAEGHLVALVVAPGWDYHWYRMNRSMTWSHKPGSTPVTPVDNAGHAIHDPRTADRGPYTDFCGFMIVMHGHIKIS